MKNGTVIHTKWVEGTVEGYGKIEYSNGDIYNGSIKHFKKEGYGELRMKARKKKFIGEFMNGEIYGWGILYDNKQDPIEGIW